MLGDLSQAETLFSEAFESRSRVLDKEHDITLETAATVGRIRLVRHEHVSAESILRPTLASYAKTEPGVWQRSACESMLAESLAAQRKNDEAGAVAALRL